MSEDGNNGGDEPTTAGGIAPGRATRVVLGGAFGGGEGGGREGSGRLAFEVTEEEEEEEEVVVVGAALGTGEGGGGNLESTEARFDATANEPSTSRARSAAVAIVAVLPSETVESKTVMLKAILALARIQLSPQFQ